jgi:Flp pilus assembly protein TadG
VSTCVLCGIKSRRRDDAGASAVEFGLVVIPLFTLLIGII